MELQNKATSLWGNFFKVGMPQIRAFHMTWFSFFLCFFAWFGIAPLMKVVRDELSLTKEQVGWCIIASVAITIVARLFIGWFCDRVGPRLAYTWLLVLGAVVVACSFTALLVRFSPEAETEASRAYQAALRQEAPQPQLEPALT